MKEKSEIDKRELQAKNLGAVCVIVVGEGEEEKKLYLRAPGRNVIGLYFGKKKNEVNVYDAPFFLLNNCAIPEVSDMDILTNDALFYGAWIQHDILFDFIEVKKNTSRKL